MEQKSQLHNLSHGSGSAVLDEDELDRRTKKIRLRSKVQ